MTRGVLFRHPSSALHDTGRGHPERAERMTAIARALEARGWFGCELRESPPATADQLARVHPPAYTDALRALCADGGGWIDGDTVTSADSFLAAEHAAGGACALVDALMTGEASVGAALHRPPGHHAEAAQAMGFCLVNNIAVAARHAAAAHGVRVAILDWDVHHGNGTNDIFAAADDVLFLSIHESPLYPGTGPVTDVGRGAGEGFTVNLPVPPGSGDATFVSLVEHVVVPVMEAFAPGILLVSAGFDAHADDPLAGCEVTDEGYARMGHVLRAWAAEAGCPVGIVLEGGYDLAALTGGLAAALGALTGVDPPPDGAQADVHPLSAAARERLVAYWPGLADA